LTTFRKQKKKDGILIEEVVGQARSFIWAVAQKDEARIAFTSLEPGGYAFLCWSGWASLAIVAGGLETARVQTEQQVEDRVDVVWYSRKG
jgi:hypothetical protein